jgi:hypothetical protein
VQTLLYTQESRREFAKQTGMSPIEQDKLPNWYFSDDQASKNKAVFLARALAEALDLQKNYSLQANLSAKTSYPNLWRAVMGPSANQPLQTLGERLISIYSKGSPQANLQALIDEYRSERRYEILWGTNTERFEGILEGIKAKHELDVMSRADWLKVEALQNRRRNEVLQAVLALKRSEAMLLGHDDAAPPPKTLVHEAQVKERTDVVAE